MNIIVGCILGLLLIFRPLSIQANEINSLAQKIKGYKENAIVEEIAKETKTKKMSQQEINDIFGEDPYLGQTSYLQSPESFKVKKEK